MVICLERGVDLHNMAQLMPLPLTVSCFSKIQLGFTFLVPAHLGSPGERAVKRVCVRDNMQKTRDIQIQTYDMCSNEPYLCNECDAANKLKLSVKFLLVMEQRRTTV